MRKRYHKVGLTVLRHIKDYYFLIPVSRDVTEKGYVYVMNDSGARIWNLIDRVKGKDEIEKAILLDYEADSKQLEQDVSDFLAQLEAAGLINSNG